MKFTPGQKVLVLEKYKDQMAPEMREYIGKVVTISKKRGSAHWPYCIVECNRWVWAEYMFTDDIDSDDPNILFQMRKRRLR